MDITNTLKNYKKDIAVASLGPIASVAIVSAKDYLHVNNEPAALLIAGTMIGLSVLYVSRDRIRNYIRKSEKE